MESSVIQPCIRIDLSKTAMKDLVEKAKDWMMFHGCSLITNQNKISTIPFTLIPSSYPRREFERAMKVQALMQKLIHDVACDYEFLSETLQTTIETDDFISKLFNIYRKLYEEGFTQKFSLGLMRSDYMLSSDEGNQIKHVEINATNGGNCWATITSKYHKYVLSELGHRDKLINIPDNNAESGHHISLVEAWKLYNNQKAVILFLGKRKINDISNQRAIEFKIRETSPDTRCIRSTLTDLIHQAELGPNRELIVNGEEVAVVYYRISLQSEIYSSKKEWHVLLLLEQSKAIKCPPVNYHLAATKKVQQRLTVPGVLERFISDPRDLALIRELFVGIYSLDMNENGDKAVAMAINDPAKYVLKPQREGGSNNLFDEELRQRLLLMKSSRERQAWILMDRINSPVQENYLIRPAHNYEEKNVYCTSELGIYGVILCNGREIMKNYPSGFLLRTKPSSDNEVGVLCGSGACDSPYLVD